MFNISELFENLLDKPEHCPTCSLRDGIAGNKKPKTFKNDNLKVRYWQNKMKAIAK